MDRPAGVPNALPDALGAVLAVAVGADSETLAGDPVACAFPAAVAAAAVIVI
jgi:hypothetical protein